MDVDVLCFGPGRYSLTNPSATQTAKYISDRSDNTQESGNPPEPTHSPGTVGLGIYLCKLVTLMGFPLRHAGAGNLDLCRYLASIHEHSMFVHDFPPSSNCVLLPVPETPLSPSSWVQCLTLPDRHGEHPWADTIMGCST